MIAISPVHTRVTAIVPSSRIFDGILPCIEISKYSWFWSFCCCCSSWERPTERGGRERKSRGAGARAKGQQWFQLHVLTQLKAGLDWRTSPEKQLFPDFPLKFGQISKAIVVGLKQETIICRPFLGALHFILFMPVPHLDQAYSTSSLSPLMVGQWTGGWSVVLRITRSNWVCFPFPSTSAIDLQKDTCLVLLSLLRIKLLPNSYSMSCQSGQGRAG